MLHLCGVVTLLLLIYNIHTDSALTVCVVARMMITREKTGSNPHSTWSEAEEAGTARTWSWS